MSQYLFLLLVLACPLMMIFIMRGHGHGGHGHAHSSTKPAEPASLEQLRRQRDELDEKIGEREWRGDGNRDRSAEHV